MLPRNIQAAGSRVLHWFAVTLYLAHHACDRRALVSRPRGLDNSMNYKFRAFCNCNSFGDVSEIQMLFNFPTRAVVATLTDVTRAMAFWPSQRAINNVSG